MLIGVAESSQGLDFEARGGLMRPTSAERDAELARQRTWAAQTDTKVSGFQEQLLTTGDRAVKTAGASACLPRVLPTQSLLSASSEHATRHLR